MKMTKRPTVVMDATPKEDAPERCACVGVERWKDGDGKLGEGLYQCRVCGKAYQA
jgi:hypothetical protein